MRVKNTGHVLNLALALLVVGLAVSRFASSAPASQRATFAVGQNARRLLPVDFTRAKTTIVLLVRNDCRFCTASMEFYRRLAASDPVHRHDVRLVVAGAQSGSILSSYARGHGLSVDDILWLPAEHIQATPTLLTVAANGVIRGMWVGKLSAVDEDDVIAGLTATGVTN